MINTYKTKEEVLAAAEGILHKTLRDFITGNDLRSVEEKLQQYGTKRKGYLGDLVEKYVFGMENNGRPEADFAVAGVELKTAPLRRHPEKTYVAKERLVFSMIDYKKVVDEKWETSSFLRKNRILLLMFYLYELDKSVIDFEFEFVHLLDLLEDISKQDAEQIKKDWEFIVAKIKRGEAHLLSEADTYYLGACTKAKNSSVVRDQSLSATPAKPRAFSLKQTYLNYLIQKNLLKRDVGADSIYKGQKTYKTIEGTVKDKFDMYIGKTDEEIMSMLQWKPKGNPKNFKRLLANRILTGSGGNKIEELEKANVTLKVITLEHSGTLKESISFPAFDYNDLVTQVWYDEESEKMSDFHAQLEMKKFLFVIFQKIKDTDKIVLRATRFWNFPMRDIGEAERVFNRTVDCVNQGNYESLPRMKDSKIVHVRPHGRNGSDKITTPQGTKEVRRCFWVNAKYIQEELGLDRI